MNAASAIISGTVTASSYDYYNEPSWAFDSNPYTYWMSNYGETMLNPEWWEIELPSQEHISRVEIHWADDSNSGKDYEIQVWSGYAWITRTKVTGNTARDNVFDITPSYRTDRIRISVTDTNTGGYKQVGISEIRILKDNLVTQETYQESNLTNGIYNYTVTAVDYYGFESLPSDEANAAVGDVTPPSPPQNLTAAASGSNVNLSWTPNTEPDLAGYHVYRGTAQGWVKLTTSPMMSTVFSDTNLMNGTYSYRVTAVDSAGNESPHSNEASLTLNTTVLESPVNLRAEPVPEGGALILSWDHAGTPAGYNLYKSTTPGGPYIRVNSSPFGTPSLLDKAVTNGIAYYYVVSAVDSVGNESSYSNEAMGIPSDKTPPSKPCLFFPTVTGTPVVLSSDTTDVSGSAEPGSTVELFENGVFAGRAAALERDVSRDFSIESGSSGASLSPDGKTLAYMNNDSVWLMELSSGDATKVLPEAYSPVWSYDGYHLAYIFRDSYGNNRIGLFDMNNEEARPLTDGINIYEGNPSWSSDGGKVSFISNRGGSDGIWIKDLVSGSLTKVETLIYPSYQKLSPDGKRVAYFEFSSLYVRDLVSGATSLVDATTDWYSFDWSFDSKRLVFISSMNGNNDIYSYDVDTAGVIQVTDSPHYKYGPSWSPDGKSVVFARNEANGSSSILITSAGPVSQGRAVRENLAWVDYLAWERSGRVASLSQNTFTIIRLEGTFSFGAVTLGPGENAFSATAVDSSVNMSAPSDEILVVYDASLTPDLEVATEDLFVYPPYSLEGQTATVTAFIKNEGEVEVNDIDIDVYLWDPQGSITLLKSETIPVIAANSEASIALALDTTAKTGPNRIMVVLDPHDEIDESNETNNLAIKEFFVAATEGIVLTATLDFDQYQSSQNVNILIDLKNSGIEREGTVETRVEDQSGHIVATIDTRTIQLPYATAQHYTLIWNTGSTYAGLYRVHVVMNDQSGIISEKSVPLTLIPDIYIEASVVTDKAIYRAQENVILSGSVNNQGENYVIPQLSIRINVADDQGAVLFTEEKALTNMLPNATNVVSSVWNSGLTAPGAYEASIEAAINGQIVATNTATFTISNAVKPSVVLRGQISVDTQSILQGEPVNISYSVTNIGNVDLSDVALSVQTVHVVHQTIYDTLTDQTDLLMGRSYSNTRQLGTQTYSAKDYLVVLRANINGVEETLAGTYFRVEGAPSVSSLHSPQHGADVESLTPLLVVNNASDPNDDKLTYEFELYGDSGLTSLLSPSGVVPETANISSWHIPIPLTENMTYYWRARAYDGHLYGEWMIPAGFRVNIENDPPTAPALSSPDDNAEVSTSAPLLTVNNASDPDSTNLTYNFDLALDANFTQIMASEAGVFEGQGTTSWQVPVNLTENTYYYWRSQADDWLTTGPWMATVRFFVNTANEAPAAPALVSPADGSEIATLYADVVAANSTDPESAVLTYLFEADTVNTFDSPDIIRSGNIPEGQNTTMWYLNTLSDNTLYYVRAKASDGQAESPWSGVISFFVNTANDAPATPVLANPSDGAGVNTFTPTLSVHNSSDMDRDHLTYEFELYGDAGMTTLMAGETGILEAPQISSWTVPVILTENMTYYWRARAYDGQAYSGWMPLASFFVNTANDAPMAPVLYAPAQGSSLQTLTPELSLLNSTDPDSDVLTYDFEVYDQGTLVKSVTGVPADPSGITSVTVDLSDNTTYTWRARAYDGDRYSGWTDTATFSLHMPSTNITVEIEVEPETLNRKSQGKWVSVEIELPKGYLAKDVKIESLRLEGVVAAEPWPYHLGCSHERDRDDHHHDYGDHDRDGDHDKREIKVKFNRAEVLKVLPDGYKVKVHVTGIVGTTSFEGVDTIRVIK
jgi:Tol biopolymer transport system component